jgi:hypothetical protein
MRNVLGIPKISSRSQIKFETDLGYEPGHNVDSSGGEKSEVKNLFCVYF